MIQKNIENPLANELLAGKFLAGDTVEIDAESGGSSSVKTAINRQIQIDHNCAIIKPRSCDFIVWLAFV